MTIFNCIDEQGACFESDLDGSTHNSYEAAEMHEAQLGAAEQREKIRLAVRAAILKAVTDACAENDIFLQDPFKENRAQAELVRDFAEAYQTNADVADDDWGANYLPGEA